MVGTWRGIGKLRRDGDGEFDEVGASTCSRIDHDIASMSLGLPKIDLAEGCGAEA